MYRWTTILRWVLVAGVLTICAQWIRSSSRPTVDEEREEHVDFLDELQSGEPFCRPEEEAKPGRILFTELPCRHSGCLDQRSICGIESAARANPRMQIDVYLDAKTRTVETQKPREGSKSACQLTAVLNQLPNVRLIRRDFVELLSQSKIGRPLVTRLSNESEWTPIHTRDWLTLVLLEQGGGIHLPSKIVSWRPLHCLADSLVYSDRRVRLEPVLALSRHHPFLEFAVRALTVDYDPWNRESTGLVRLAEAFEVFCRISNQTRIEPNRWYSCHKNSSIGILDPAMFSPVESLRTLEYFDPWSSLWPPERSRIQNRLKAAQVAIIDGAGWGLPVAPSSLYADLARRFCPATWNALEQLQPPLKF